MHLGGGSPTFFSDDELRELMALLRRSFRFAAGGEFSIEIDPRTVDADRIAALAQMGFNRLSFGVQDFDPAVQKAVHRVQPIERVFAVVAAARACDFESVSVDLIYGLPRQSPDSFDRTVAQIKLLRPDRIALYRYAHLPDQFKSQRRMPIADLPSAEAKGLMLSRSLLSLQEAGYIQVGVDLLALPTDPLAVAKRQGRLHRNFQGYSAQLEGDVIGLGLSANGRIGSTYSQNATSLTAYCDCLDQGQFPIVRGLTLARDDLIRRAVIMAIMCQGQVLFESIDLAFLVDSRSYFSQELDALQELIDQGIVSIDDSGIQVAKMDWPFLRAVSMVFDRYLQADRNRTQFSKML
jgi:oxygen-independent coproporphyrinogen-3 oxidase